MKYMSFTVSVFDSEGLNEINSFLASHRIYSVRKELIQRQEESHWAFLIKYEGRSFSKTEKKSRIDYWEVLPHGFQPRMGLSHLTQDSLAASYLGF